MIRITGEFNLITDHEDAKAYEQNAREHQLALNEELELYAADDAVVVRVETRHVSYQRTYGAQPSVRIHSVIQTGEEV